ncbi:Cysteine protease [Phytophthora megakarya]|uniref:Cysteine protease n=1 Tax=Phytophthora megakarya TaxID=4795 RepID=A0A225VQ58_9STRA|nr:Cysteine protease [Phytophthora megakarya]
MRSHQERYREAVRATHLIANELADIEAEAEFSEMLTFVLNQWRNIRQKKRTSHGSSSEMKASAGVAMSNEERERIMLEFDPFDPKARKVGRPQKAKKKTVAGEKKTGNGMKQQNRPVRPLARDVYLESSKYSEADKKKPKFKRIKNPFLILDPFFCFRYDCWMHAWRLFPQLTWKLHGEEERRFKDCTVYLPLNFQNAHWCCIVIKVNAKRIYYYDPLNQTPYMNSAKAVATTLKISGLDNYDVILQNNPIQFDAYSCGVYVCWMCIRQVVPGPPLDMSSNALTRRRFELFFYLLTGRLLPAESTEAAHDDGTEKKRPRHLKTTR